MVALVWLSVLLSSVVRVCGGDVGEGADETYCASRWAKQSKGPSPVSLVLRVPSVGAGTMSDSLAGPGDSLAMPGDSGEPECLALLDFGGADGSQAVDEAPFLVIIPSAASLVVWQADLCIIITRYSVNVPPDCRCVIAVREFLLAFDQRIS